MFMGNRTQPAPVAGAAPGAAAPAGAPRPQAPPHSQPQRPAPPPQGQPRPAPPPGQARPPVPGQPGPARGVPPPGHAPRIDPRTAPTTAVPVGAPDKLSSYSFIDMYIHQGKHRPTMVRALRCASSGFVSLNRGVAKAPPVLEPDIRNLYEKIVEKWESSGQQREFQIQYHGQNYRCALLAPPGTGWEEPGAGRAADFDWIVRHVRSKAPSFDDLNMPGWMRSEIDGLIPHRGLVLVGGPFASGKTTLANCAFDRWVTQSRDVGLALEDPPEIPLEKVTDDSGIIYQFDLTDRSMQQAIKNARRMSPRYVFLGEIRSGDVALELLAMAVSGPLVICTIHASDLVNSIVSLFRFASDAMSEEAARDMISSCVRQVFYQEIVNGVVTTKTGKIEGEESHLIRANIRNGQFRALMEIFQRQEINRINRRPGA